MYVSFQIKKDPDISSAGLQLVQRLFPSKAISSSIRSCPLSA